MKENDVIETIRSYILTQFPMECACCHKRYSTFADFIRDTTYAGKPISYDAEQGDWIPFKPIGTVGFSQCSCGNTLDISTKDMDLETLWKLMNWARQETYRRGITASDLLDQLRSKVDSRVLEECKKKEITKEPHKT